MPAAERTEPIDFILANVGHLHRLRITQLLETLGLYQGQPQLLRHLWRQEGQSQNELAARMRITPATLTRMLQRMEKSGFIQRSPDPDDQRVVRVYLTGAGRAVKSDVEKVFRQIEAETFANLSEEERAGMYRLLVQLRQNLISVTGEEPWRPPE